MTAHSKELHPAWPLLLQQQTELLQQHSACTLLCVSNSMAACLHEVAAGQLQCQIARSSAGSSRDASAADKAAMGARLQSFSRWLSKHGLLLQSLDLDVSGAALQAAVILAALQQAAAAAMAAGSAPAGTRSSSSSSSSSVSALQLQSFKGPLVAPLLQHLPGHSLTSLIVTDEHEQTNDWDASVRIQHSLQHLSKLQRLVFFDEGHTNANLLVPALAHMQQLTYLDIGMSKFLRHLPTSLLELHIGAESNDYTEYDELQERPVGNLNLGHPQR
jgi:hypothetical protein